MALVVFEAPANALETHLLGSKWRKEKSLLKCVARPSGAVPVSGIFERRLEHMPTYGDSYHG